MTDQANKIITFQIKLPETINRLVLSNAALSAKSKHDFIVEAIQEKLERERVVG